MAFYLRPPSGNISLEKLEAFACKRLWFLIKILEADKNNLILTDLVYKDASLVADSDCLIEGTKKDQISHFILRMAFSESDEMWEWFEKAEVILFNFRFLCMKPDEIFRSLKPVWRTIDRLTWNSDLNLLSLKGALKVLQEIPSTCGTSWPDVIDKYFAGSDSEYFIVPFLYALQLVSERKVMLDRGEALVPFSKLHNVMTSIFQNLVHFSRPNFQRIQRKLVDDRITKLFHKLKSYLKSKVFNIQFCSEIGFGHLNHEAVDSEVQFFPPCMAYNHKQLRLKHRLKHHARIRYTLFLKEAGLPINEALMFWRNEYSQKCKDHKEVKCSHSWDKDAKRFMYNIRHLYGLEGGRTNYTAHSCASLQSRCDGCPFVDFDEEHLRDLLREEKILSNHENIMALVKQKRPSNACSVFFWEKLKKFIQFEEKLFSRKMEQHHTSTEFPTTMKTLSFQKERICSRSQPPIHSSNCKKNDCFQVEETKEFFSDDTSKSPGQIAVHERKNIVIDKSMQSDIDMLKKQFSVTRVKDNEQQTVSWQKSFEEISKSSFLKPNKRSESEEFVTSLLAEKISCLSTSDSLSESLHKDGDPPNSILNVNSYIHSNFSDFVSPLQLQLSRLHQDLNCNGNNFLEEQLHTRPIEFYKYLKEIHNQSESCCT